MVYANENGKHISVTPSTFSDTYPYPGVSIY